MSLESFIEERKKLLAEAEYDLENFDYDVVIKHKYNIKSRTKEENEAVARRSLERTIQNLKDYIETPNVFERQKLLEERETGIAT